MKDFMRFKSLMGWSLVAALAAFPAAVGCDSDDDGGTGGVSGTGGIRATGGSGGLGGRGGLGGTGGAGTGGTAGASTGGTGGVVQGGAGGRASGGGGGLGTGGVGGSGGRAGANGGNGGNGGRGGAATGGAGGAIGGAGGGIAGAGGVAGAGGLGGANAGGAAGSAGAGGAGGANADILTDGQVLAVLLDANNGELRTTDIATARGQDSRVRDFAMELRDAHSAAVTRLNALGRDENLSGMDSGPRQALSQAAAVTAEVLWMATPTAFDKAFLQAQISLHTSVLTSIDNVLLPSTSSGALKAEINQERAAVVSHLAHAQTLLAALNGNGAGGAGGSSGAP